MRDLYLKESLSATQIAEKIGLSKQAVLARLRQEGIQKTALRGRSSENFRYPYPTYGYRVVDGRLLPCAKEMKAVRIIVEMRDCQGQGWEVIADELNKKGFRSRTGLLWTRVRVKRVHKHWSGKV